MANRFRTLCMWDVEHTPGCFSELERVSDVIVERSDAAVLHRLLPEFDAYLATLGVVLNAQLIHRASVRGGGRLKIVTTPSTGLDHLDLTALEEAGVELQCIKTDFELLDQITATAEMAWALLLAAVRKVPKAYEAAMRGEWDRNQFRGRQLSGKTLGVLGVGRLGRMVVEYGKAFRMNVIGCDHNPLKRVDWLEYVDFDQLLERSDVISIHIHLTPENEHLLNAKAFERMKDGVVIVNTSRGLIIDEAALLANLASGKVGAAGLDVVHGEWRDDLVDHPVIRYARDHDNVVVVPHLGGVTFESQMMSHQWTANKLARRLRELESA